MREAVEHVVREANQLFAVEDADATKRAGRFEGEVLIPVRIGGEVGILHVLSVFALDLGPGRVVPGLLTRNAGAMDS